MFIHINVIMRVNLSFAFCFDCYINHFVNVNYYHVNNFYQLKIDVDYSMACTILKMISFRMIGIQKQFACFWNEIVVVALWKDKEKRWQFYNWNGMRRLDRTPLRQGIQRNKQIVITLRKKQSLEDTQVGYTLEKYIVYIFAEHCCHHTFSSIDASIHPRSI